MSDVKKECFEISLPTLLAISHDIVQRAIRCGVSDEFLANCIVRFPEKQKEDEFTYELGFPKFPF